MYLLGIYTVSCRGLGSSVAGPVWRPLGHLWSPEADGVTLIFQDLYCVRSDLGNLLKALGRLEEAKVGVE